MNVFYFVRRFPRRHKTANQQKIFSLAQTFLNQGHKINFVSADQSNPNQYDHLKQYPVNLVHVAPKKINASLTAAQIKPDIAIFNNFQMEQMYSAYIYNKWSKCPKVLQINYSVGLQRWRKNKYSADADNFLVPYNEKLYDPQNIFHGYELNSIMRSDFYITPNDFLYYLVKAVTKQPQRISILTHGYPTKQFASQTKLEQFRPFESRKHFVFLGDFSKDSCNNMLHNLIYNIWPILKRQIPQAELHIYGTALNQSKAIKMKAQLETKGILLKGYVQDIQLIQKYKLMLYPARFSTGLKSKIVESFLHHTPVVTTPIGAEGMFYEMLEPKYAQSQSETDSGFISEREYTLEEQTGQSKLNSYYNSNSLQSNQLKRMSFGGSFLNYSHLQFALSAKQLYSNKQKWQKSLRTAQRTILKNQNEVQLEINLGQTLSKLQFAVYKARGNRLYEEEWKKILKSKQYERKVYQYF